MKNHLLIFLFFLSASSYGFDGKRSGFQLSFGAGLSNIDAKFSQNRQMKSTVSAYSLRFGWGFGERFSLFFGKESHLYKYDGEDVLNEISAIGAKIYVLQNVYLYGGSGIGGFVNEITLDSSKTVMGTGSYYGLGLQVFKNFSIELGASQMDVDQDDLNKDGVVSPYEQTSSHVLFMFQLY